MNSTPKETKLSRGIFAKAAQFGLFVSDPAQFLAAAQTEVVLLNKAGTLTSSARRVVKSRLAHSSPLTLESDLLALAAGVEQHVKHPIAQSILREARRKKLEIPEVHDVRVIPGQGVTGTLNGESITLGGPALLTSRNIPIYVEDLVRADSANQAGNTVIYVLLGSQLIGMIELSETVLPEAEKAVRDFHARKIRVAMVTGDAAGVADRVAKELGIAEVFSEVSPNAKSEVVRKLKADGSKVTAVGSLETDAMALAEAQVAIATNSRGKTESTAAGLHLDSADLEAVLKTILLSKGIKSKTSLKYIIIFVLVALLVGAVAVIVSPK